MAKITTNPTIEAMRGSLGKDLYFRTTKDGRVIISKKPDFSNRQFSEAQLNAQNRTKQAADYATVAYQENPVYAQKAEGTAKNAYNVAVGDWHNPPEIYRIDYRRGIIKVYAEDDVMVTRVRVSVLDEAGQTLEQGEAKPVTNVVWEYQTAHRGQIRVEAWDLPGNTAREEYTPTSETISVWDKPIRTRRCWRKRRR